MIPPMLAATFAKPLVKWGAIAGGIVMFLVAVWTHGCSTGKEMVQREWDAMIAQQAAQHAQEAVKAQAMESAVVKAHDQSERVIAAKADQIKKEVVHHAKQDPKPLSAATVAIYDRLIELPNEAGGSVPAADSGTGTPEVSRGGLAIEAAPRVSVPLAAGEPVELTMEELAQAAVDFAEKYALMKNAYKGLSDWNDGREKIELERLQQEVP